MSKENKFPEVVTGAIIYNDKNEILLIKNNKWKDVWTIPGGHVEFGETMEEAMIRETKEETGLNISNLEFISVLDGINPKNFYEKRHFIFIDYFARVIGGREKKSREMEEYKWILAKEALELRLSDSVKLLIKKFIEREKETSESWEDKYKRALADYQNLLRQTAQEKQEFAKYALTDFLHDILPVYDHLKMSLANLSADEKDSSWVEGVRHVLKQFKEVLKSKGIEEIKTVGEKFNHETMEAIDGEGEIVKQELMSGYKLGGRVIRPAKVIIK